MMRQYNGKNRVYYVFKYQKLYLKCDHTKI